MDKTLKNAIDRLVRQWVPRVNAHLSDDRLASLFCRELSWTEGLIARWHLAHCRHCRGRRDDLQGRRADRMLEVYRSAFDHEALALPEEPRAEFARRLERHIRDTSARSLSPRRGWAPRFVDLFLANLPPMNLSLAMCLLFGVATAVSFLFWWQQRVPALTSTALLRRAENGEASKLAASTGVIYQAIRITTPQQTLERSIYRDLRTGRPSKRIKLTEEEETLRTKLFQARVDWDEPISAAGYEAWHDRQPVFRDTIVRAGLHLLKLTTTVPDGSISEQSLTIRDTDFHPVGRSVAFRDSGPVEIAELDFKILPWEKATPDAFDDLSGRSSVAAGPARILQFPHIPATLSPDQIDMSELGARLILNQLHADTGEQIEIQRTSFGVQVGGIVETDERKLELQSHLRMMPHVTVSIQSVGDLKSARTESAPVNIQTASMPDQPSPLDTYLQARGLAVHDINIFAERLFSTALTISQESKAIADLQTRFNPQAKSAIASATVSELIYSHRERLTAALKFERDLLAELHPASALPGSVTKALGTSLTDSAERNLALSKELTQAHNVPPRRFVQILAELSVALEDLTLGAHEVYGRSQDASTLSGKK